MSRCGMVVIAAGALCALSGAALAQTVTPPPAAAPAQTNPFGPVQADPAGEPAETAPDTADLPAEPSPAAGLAVGPIAAPAAEPVAPADAGTDPAASNGGRVFVDTRVTDVRVGDALTVATMSQSPLSACPSNEYVFERDRAKWLFQTGRLLQAMKEGAVVRVSFTCIEGYQSINAVQFLSPPQAAVAQGTPRPGAIVRVAPQPAAARPDAVPLPTEAADQSRPLDERVREIPIPGRS